MVNRSLLLVVVACLLLQPFYSWSEDLSDESRGFDFSGEARVRYESLDGQFRSGQTGSDQLLALRNLVRADYSRAWGKAVLELHDARTFLDDSGTPLSTSFVNTAGVLQAYLGVSLGENSTLNLGRFTLDIGSRRFVERNDFRNTINSFSGAHWTRTSTAGNSLDVFVVTPVRKLPRDRDELDSNSYAFDKEDAKRRFWGVHWQRPDLIEDVQLDLFVYGLSESDSGSRPTPNRRVFAPGLRLHRKPSAGALDFDVESAYRFGTRRASSEPEAAELDVRAMMLHAEVGYTFTGAWALRIGLEYDLATGGDGGSSYKRYERLFGTRRGDLGNTSIHGPLTRSNISVPGIRFSFKRGDTDGRVVIQRADLESASDQWVVARLGDSAGRFGRHIGTTLDFRVRHWLRTNSVRLEIGGSALSYGRFAESVAQGPEETRTLYGYGQITWYF